MYVFITRWDEMRQKAESVNADWPMPDTIQEAFDYFTKIARKKNITCLTEWVEGYGILEEAVKNAKK